MRTFIALSLLTLGLSTGLRAETAAPVAAEAPAAKTEAAPAVEAVAESSAWLTNHEQALRIAAEEKHCVLIDFTGSDWCVWCVRLHKEILETKFFQDYARSSLVLLEVDLPREKKLPPELLRQNQSLAEKYKVEGFPTIILLDPSGREIGRTGYMQGGPKTFIRDLKRIIASAETPAPAK
jgi:thioredoxin-related protein